MQDIAINKTFVCQLTAFLKIGIYSNRGTDDENLLNKCIRTYNKYKLIETSQNISSEDEVFVRKAMKRLNLILKIDENGDPVDIKTKENQLRIFDLQCHPSLENDSFDEMAKFLNVNKIDILTGIPLKFLLVEGPYGELLWQYTRSLYYVSQMVLSVQGMETNPKKKKIFDESCSKFETILFNITDLETKLEIDGLMAVDSFLGNKLVNTSKADIGQAKDEVIKLFSNKGMGENNAIMNMIQKISGELEKVDLSQGNVMQCMFGIAQTVANDMRGDLENNPDGLQNAFGAIAEVFQDTMNSSMKDGEELPAEMKAMMANLVNMNNHEESRDAARNMLMSSTAVPEDIKNMLANIPK